MDGRETNQTGQLIKGGRISNSKVIMSKQFFETMGNSSNVPKQGNSIMNKTPEP